MAESRLTGSEKLIFTIAIIVITVFSALGFYLIDAEPKIKTLVVSGHNHILSFAYGAILFGLLLRFTGLPETVKRWLAVWMSVTYLGPLALIWAGLSGKTDILQFTSPLFMGSFVVLWLILAVQLARPRS